VPRPCTGGKAVKGEAELDGGVPPPQWKPFADPPPAACPEPLWSTLFGRAPRGAGAGAPCGLSQNRAIQILYVKI
jgi:hypothetical protein